MERLYNNLAKKAIFSICLIISTIFVVEPVFALVPNDPEYNQQAIFMKQINAEAAWDVSTGSKKVVVAFIDTGMDIWHEDLRDNLWVNQREIPDNGKDDDNNGYVDDVNGWNFVENNNNVRPSVFDVADDKEAVRHGTIVGGLIGARGNNLLDGTGLSQKVSIMTLRAIRSNGTGSLKSVTEAVNYAINNGADIISMSFMGDSFEQRFYEVMRQAYKKGIVIVVAAGNYDSADSIGDTSKKPTYPGCFDAYDGEGENWLLTVGSVDSEDRLSDFSEYGKCIDIMAPGEYIYSTERFAPQYGYPNQFSGPWFGTSFATPLVAATAALIKSVHPEYTAKEIINTILSTADPIDIYNAPHAGQVGRGRLNAGLALTMAAGSPIKRGRGGFWYVKNSELRRYDIAKDITTSVSSIPEEKIISQVVYPAFLKEETAILAKRRDAYFLDVYKENGDFSGSTQISKTNLISENVFIKYFESGFYIVSYKYNKKTARTDYRIYNTTTKKVVSRYVVDQSMVDVNDFGEMFSATLVRGAITIKKVSTGKIVATIKNSTKILDYKIVGDKAILLIIRDGKVNIASVGLSDQKIVTKNLNLAVSKLWKIKTLNFGDKNYYLPFLPEKGRYVLLDQDFYESLTIVTPGLPATIR
ncbi:MAG: S8 family peptidase [Patescibacteria group bacterium]|jgi:hypothetical protein